MKLHKCALCNCVEFERTEQNQNMCVCGHTVFVHAWIDVPELDKKVEGKSCEQKTE